MTDPDLDPDLGSGSCTMIGLDAITSVQRWPFPETVGQFLAVFYFCSFMPLSQFGQNNT